MSTGRIAIREESIETEASAYMSLETFLEKYADVDDGMKYEWNDGTVEISESMNQEQLKIQAILFHFFLNTKICKLGGVFTAETDMFTSVKQLRRHDLAIYTKEQIEAAAKREQECHLRFAPRNNDPGARLTPLTLTGAGVALAIQALLQP